MEKQGLVKEYNASCQQIVKPLEDACKTCTRVKYVLRDGELVSVCERTCGMYKLTKGALELYKKEYDKKLK